MSRVLAMIARTISYKSQTAVQKSCPVTMVKTMVFLFYNRLAVDGETPASFHPDASRFKEIAHEDSLNQLNVWTLEERRNRAVA